MPNMVPGIDDNDWIYFEESSVTGYGYKPLRILGTGFDESFGSYYIDVEEADGYDADLGQVFAEQIVYSYNKVDPLALVPLFIVIGASLMIGQPCTRTDICGMSMVTVQ